MRAVVVGAGVFGAWTAYFLRAAGAVVTLVDAYGAANSKASSGDESRITRCGYGADEIYSRWAWESLADWRELFARIGGGHFPLFHACGVLWLTTENEYSTATFTTLRRCGYPVERLEPEEVRSRFPQFRTDHFTYGLFEPSAGILMARRAVQALVGDLASSGVRTLRGRVRPPAGGGAAASVRTESGEELAGDVFVFACGPWLPTVFPDLLGARIRPTRQTVIYFGAPAGDLAYAPERLPAWLDFTAGMYGLPDLEHRGVKVGIDRHGPPFDPDRDDRVPDPESIETVRAWLTRTVPGLAHAPIAETRVCQYENTDTGDFLIDRHPDVHNVWVVGGGSGHGFKHGPAVGRYVAGVVTGAMPPEPKFALATRGTAPRRVVY